MAEAFAEKLHKQAREEWGYGGNEMLNYDDLVAEKYRGIRPAFGYPACPDHTEKRTLFDLLNADCTDGNGHNGKWSTYDVGGTPGGWKHNYVATCATN